MTHVQFHTPSHHASDHCQWIAFPDTDAKLHRILLPNGNEGLALCFGDPQRSASLRQRAVQAGFMPTSNGRSVILDLAGQITPLSLDGLAKALAGERMSIPKDALLSAEWTIDKRGTIDKQDKDAASPVPGSAFQDAQALALLGTNHCGEEVFEHPLTGRVRKVQDEDGYRLVGETSADHPTLYLRATTKDDLPRIARGLIMRAARGAITPREFETHLDAVFTGSDGHPFHDHQGHDHRDSDCHTHALAAFTKTIKLLLIKEILGIVGEEATSRKSYHRASRLQDNLGRFLEFERGDEAGFIPSLKFLVLLKRLIKIASQAEFSGSWQLGLAVPSTRCATNAPLQVIDMTETATDGLADRVLNSLANRLADGASYLLVTGQAEDKAVSTLRYAVGKAYILDIIAEFSPHLATGHHDDDPITMIVVGARRVVSEDSLPAAARRTFSLTVQEDFDRLHTEILRSRRKIREWIELQDTQTGESAAKDTPAQRPYVPLSQATPSCTMIPKSLEGATARALRRVARHFEPEGGVDPVIADILDVDASRVGRILTAEQVDAVAMCIVARLRNRSFLLADQTGIGKGRSLATLARQHLRKGGRILYFTENAEINIPDVWRDMQAVGADHEAVPTIIASRPVILHAPGQSDAMLPGFGPSVAYRTLTAADRRSLFASGAWPEGSNMILTNYSQFRGKAATPSRSWSRDAIDGSVLVILDESQNALNPQSNTGEAIRDILARSGRGNTVFATATPMRDQFSAHLYHGLLPDSEPSRLEPLLSTHLHGGEIAQESFTTMLAEDGVFLRRDHDLSNIDFQVRLPVDRRMTEYREIMDSFSPLIEAILDCSLAIGDIIGDSQGRIYNRLIEEGFDPATAAAETTALSQYSHSPGGALSRLSRLLINAIKVDQVVTETLNEIRENRKPLITFHSTGNELFKELIEAGSVPEDGQCPGLTAADQIRRVAAGIYRIRVADELIDARTLSDAIATRAATIEAMIADLPPSLPASPLDHLQAALEGHGLRVGEISGRQLVYRDGHILRRASQSRREIVDAFNAGDLDILIYNQAGATGGSYHAAPEFRDQRPRSLVEMETPLDIVKYVQAQGRSNRYGQVARPRIVSVMTGLIPEMRILQQRNCKLRSMGASVDGNRSHPLLLDDIPDLLNVVGDRAASQVLAAHQDLTRRLGFLPLAQKEDPLQAINQADFETRSSNSTQSIANKVLSRSIVLPVNDQTRLINLIRYEFDAIIEELDSKDANPLRTRELPGEVEIRASTLYSGIESLDTSHDTSAFFAPLYLATGIYRFNERPISGDELQHLVNQSRIRDGAMGFAPRADWLAQTMPTHLQPFLRPGVPYSEAIRQLEDQTYRFRRKYQQLQAFHQLLAQIKPGKVMHFDDEDHTDTTLRTIVRLVSPEPKYAAMPQAYKIHTVEPGQARAAVYSLNRLINMPRTIRFATGLDIGDNPRHLEDFVRQSDSERSTPVQILTGNLLEAIELARTNRLGSMSLYRDTRGKIHRGVVVRKKNIDVRILPTTIPTTETAKSLVSLLARDLLMVDDRRADRLVFWAGERHNPEIYLCFARDREAPESGALVVELTLPYARYASGRHRDPARRQLVGYYADKPAMHELMWVTHYEPHKHGFALRRYRFPRDMEVLGKFFDCLQGIRLMADSAFRDSVNRVAAELEDASPAAAGALLAGWEEPTPSCPSPALAGMGALG